MPFIPHTHEDIEAMLKTIGVNDIEDLYDEIPKALPKAKLENIPEGLNEIEMTRLMNERMPKMNPHGCFIGAGAYDHFIPAAVWEITGRGEFYTAYTPYQAEASQGTLQLIYEYQTMMANLMGMDVSNASLYDGATALAESVLMAVRLRSDNAKRILVHKSVSPLYRKVLQSIVQQQGIIIEEIPYDKKLGNTDLNHLKNIQYDDIAAIVIPQPNFFGVLEPVDELTHFAHQKKALTVALVNPIAMALLKEPGEWGESGADIVCGEGQPLGIPLSSGGPYFGFICCKKEYVRQLPGRIVGRTHDQQGRVGYTLTLQTREQHIRRSKATSNICTNQGLMVTAAAIYMSLMSTEGLKRVASTSHSNACDLLKLLKPVPKITPVFNSPFFHEFVVRFDRPVQSILNQLSENGIQAGYSLTEYYPELGESLLICVTETKTAADLQNYQRLLLK